MKRFKRIISVLLVSILCLPFVSNITIANAEYSSNQGDIESESALVNKYISLADEENLLYNIILEIEGKNSAEHPPTDIMLVVDQSNSMADARAEKVAEALTILGDKFLTDTVNIQLGYVGFGNDVGESTVLDLTNDKTVFTDFTNSQSFTNGGTHLQAGLKKAKELLAVQPDDHQKIIIILSDGLTTYSYKPTAVADIVDNEVRSYGEEIAKYKVTEYDYDSTIGIGGYYGLFSDTYKIGDAIISNTGDATIGELLDFKEKDNHYVFAVGIELADFDIEGPNTYSYVNEQYSSTHDINHRVTASWTETIRDGLYNPGEDIHVEATYTNESDKEVIFSLTNNLVADTDKRPLPAKANDFLENTGEVIGYIYHNDVVVEELNLDQLIARANTPFPSTVTLSPGDTYKMTTDFKMKDFTLMGPGVDVLNTLHIALFKVDARVAKSSMSFSAFGYDTRENSGPVLGFHSVYTTKQQGEYVLKNLATDGVEGQTYFDASSINDLASILNDDIYTIITDSIVNGTVTDPMSDPVDLVTGAFSGADYRLWATKDGVNDASLLEGVKVNYDVATDTLTVTGLNLSKGERVFVEYQVQVLTDHTSFSYDTPIPTNGRATLEPKAGEELIEFPIPTVTVNSEVETVTLRYYANAEGDTSVKHVPTEVYVFKVGETVDVHDLTPTRDTHNFLHWLASTIETNENHGLTFGPGTSFVITADMELHAQWNAKPEDELIVEVIPPTGVSNQDTVVYSILFLASLAALAVVLKKKQETH